MEFIARMKAALLTYVSEVIKNEGVEAATSLSAMEVAVKQMLHEIGNTVLVEWLEAQDGKYPADFQPCECGHPAQYVRHRNGVSLTLLG